MTRAEQWLQRLRLDIAIELEALPDDAARVRCALDHCEATGGSFTAPGLCGAWGSHLSELDLLGVRHNDFDDAAAVRGWCRAVLRIEREYADEGRAA